MSPPPLSDPSINAVAEAGSFLWLSGKMRGKTQTMPGDLRRFVELRRVLTQGASDLLLKDGETSAILEARRLMDAEKVRDFDLVGVHEILDFALAGVVGLSHADMPLAEQTFESIVRPIAEAVGDGANVANNLAVSSESVWQRIADAIIESHRRERTHFLLMEALSGLKRLHGVGTAKQHDVPPEMLIVSDGPYLLTGTATLHDHLGRDSASGNPVALCRCGRSQKKPFCDGAHVHAEFTDAKDARHIPDRRDTYQGQSAIVYDNRSVCAHSGFCTDRLNSVFHLGEEPFVTASGARLDEIVRAVRKCPSGALSFGMDGREVRDHVDQSRAAIVQISRDGPYRITGSIPLVAEGDDDVARSNGASTEHFSLCRCGSSLNKPFCSGMHWDVEFTDPVIDQSVEPTLFEWAGGYPALLDMTTIFYSKYVPQDDLIGPLFADMSSDHPERVAAWLSEVFGGPKFYSERYGGYRRMISQHVGKNIRPEQRQRWATLMAQSAEDAGLPSDAEFRAAFIAYIEWGSRIAVENSGPAAAPPPNMPVPQWWWVCNTTPGSRMSALPDRRHELAPAAMPSEGQPVEFESHIKHLFRAIDRNSMKFAFDLWLEADVSRHGEEILSRLKNGTMPCDGAWPREKIDLFESWFRSAPV
jgi:CDGSH-type Zn-finger protein/truncated hemoglobin YjbI